MHGACVIFIAELMVHEDHIKGALVVDYIIHSFFDMLEGVLLLNDDLRIVCLEFFFDIFLAAHALSNALSERHRMFTVIDSFE